MGVGGFSFPWATLVIAVAMAYAGVGLLVALAYLLLGLDESDPAARQSYAFRVLLGPGLALLWPLVLYRWLMVPAKNDAPAPWRQAHAHRIVWLLLAVLVPATLIAGFMQRQPKVPMPPVQKLSLVAPAP